MILYWTIFLYSLVVSYVITFDGIWDSQMVVAVNTAAHTWAVPRISLNVPENSLANHPGHICWAIVAISTVVGVLFLSVSWLLSGSFGDWVRSDTTLSIWGYLFWMVSFPVILMLFQLQGALAMSITDFHWRQTQGANPELR